MALEGGNQEQIKEIDTGKEQKQLQEDQGEKEELDQNELINDLGDKNKADKLANDAMETINTPGYLDTALNFEKKLNGKSPEELQKLSTNTEFRDGIKAYKDAKLAGYKLLDNAGFNFGIKENIKKMESISNADQIAEYLANNFTPQEFKEMKSAQKIIETSLQNKPDELAEFNTERNNIADETSQAITKTGILNISGDYKKTSEA